MCFPFFSPFFPFSCFPHFCHHTCGPFQVRVAYIKSLLRQDMAYFDSKSAIIYCTYIISSAYQKPLAARLLPSSARIRCNIYLYLYLAALLPCVGQLKSLVFNCHVFSGSQMSQGMAEKLSMVVRSFSTVIVGLVVGFYTSWKLTLVLCLELKIRIYSIY